MSRLVTAIGAISLLALSATGLTAQRYVHPSDQGKNEGATNPSQRERGTRGMGYYDYYGYGVGSRALSAEEEPPTDPKQPYAPLLKKDENEGTNKMPRY